MPPKTKENEEFLLQLFIEKLEENKKQENAKHESIMEALRSITNKLLDLKVQPPPLPDPPDPNSPFTITTNSPIPTLLTPTATLCNPFSYNHNKAWTPNKQYYPYQQPHQVQISTLENKTQMPLLQNSNTGSETKDPNSIINSEKEVSEFMSQISEAFNTVESLSTANTTITAEKREENSSTNEQSKREQIATKNHKWTRSPSNASSRKVPYTINDNIAVGRRGRQESTAKRLEPSPEKKFQRGLRPIRGKESGLVVNRKINVGVQRDSSSGQPPWSLWRIRKVGGTTMVCGEGGENEITRVNESKNKEEDGKKEGEIFEKNEKEKFEENVESENRELSVTHEGEKKASSQPFMKSTICAKAPTPLLFCHMAYPTLYPKTPFPNLEKEPLQSTHNHIPFVFLTTCGPHLINALTLITPALFFPKISQFNALNCDIGYNYDGMLIWSLLGLHDNMEMMIHSFLEFESFKKFNLEDKVDFKGIGNDRIFNIIVVMIFSRKGIG